MTFQKRSVQPHYEVSAIWQQCINSWITEKSNSPETSRQYKRTIIMFLDAIQKPLELATREDVLRFLAQPSSSPRNPGAQVSVGTSNNRLAILGSLFSYASVYTISGPDHRPIPLLQTPPATLGLKPHRTEPTYKALSQSELERLFSVIPDSEIGMRDRALFLVFLYSCRRLSEIQGLSWGDIEQATLINADGTRRQGMIYRWKNKGSREKSELSELPLPAYASIVRYLEKSGRLATIGPDDPVFAPTMNASADGRLTVTSMNHRLKHYCRLASLDTKRISIHSFRHTGCQVRFSQGEDILSLQRLLRHRTLSTTQIYLTRLVSVEDHGARLLEKQWACFS